MSGNRVSALHMGIMNGKKSEEEGTEREKTNEGEGKTVKGEGG